MKKIIAIILTIFSILVILESMNFGHALMMFLLAGVIPGTNIALGATQMLEIFALSAGFTVARLMTYAIHSVKPRFTIPHSQARA